MDQLELESLLADVVRETMTATFNVLVDALRQAPDDMSARQAAESLQSHVTHLLQARLVASFDQLLAQRRDNS